MIVGIILAGGKGTRMESQDTNKTALDFNGRPVLAYGLDLFKSVPETKILVVKGAFGESVTRVVKEYDPKIWLTTQRYRLGTGHAAVVADRFLVKNKIKPEYVLVGAGDHMMFYHPKTIKKMLSVAQEKKATVVAVTAEVENPYALGRIIRDDSGAVVKIVEEKNATEKEKKIKEINAALYCFEYEFFHEYLSELKRNKVTNEYYLTDLIELAVENGKKVWPLMVPFEEMGIGINTKEEMRQSAVLFKKIHEN